MPSPTSRTRPTSRASSAVRYCSISFPITEMISSALNLMAGTLEELVPDIDVLGADGGIVEPVADAHLQAAEHVGIDSLVKDRLAAEQRAELADQTVALGV